MLHTHLSNLFSFRSQEGFDWLLERASIGGIDIKGLMKLADKVISLRNTYCHQSTVHWNDLKLHIQPLYSLMATISDASNPTTEDCLTAVKHLLDWILFFGNKPPIKFTVPVIGGSMASLGPRMVFKQAMDDLVFVGRDECFAAVVRTLADVPQRGLTRYIALHGEEEGNQHP